MAKKVAIDTIEKLIYKLETNLNSPQKYSSRDRQLMHDGIEWLRDAKNRGKTFEEILEEFRNFPMSN